MRIVSLSIPGSIAYFVHIRSFFSTMVGVIALFLSIIPIFSITFIISINVSTQHFTSCNKGSNGDNRSEGVSEDILHYHVRYNLVKARFLDRIA